LFLSFKEKKRVESMAPFLPVGFRFRPSDEELVRDYLLKKVKGEELPWDGIGECDLYGEKPPWQICGDQEDEKVYFFARLKKLSKSRVARTAGSGVWHENSSHHTYDEEGDVIGSRKLFCFKVKDGSTMMHEFSLVGSMNRVPVGSSVPFKRKDQNQGLGSKGAARIDLSKERGFAVKLFNPMGLKQNMDRPILIWKPIWKERPRLIWNPIWNFAYQLVITLI
jgi:hypothetical protein